MKKNYKRHGDLGFHPTNESIEGLKKVGGNGYVLAEGETTGHRHIITSKVGTVDIYKDEKTNELVLVIDGEAILTHEEHKTISVPMGIYRMKHQKEYNYHELQGQQVID